MRIFAVALIVFALAPLGLTQEMRRQAQVPAIRSYGDVTVPLPPIAQLPPRAIDTRHVMEEAAELERLAAELRPHLDRAASGVVDANLGRRLKELEKLVKHLRRDLDP